MQVLVASRIPRLVLLCFSFLSILLSLFLFPFPFCLSLLPFSHSHIFFYSFSSLSCPLSSLTSCIPPISTLISAFLFLCATFTPSLFQFFPRFPSPFTLERMEVITFRSSRTIQASFFCSSQITWSVHIFF